MNNIDIVFIIICTIFVFFMTPGLAIFYGGLVRRRNVVGIMTQCYVSIGIVSVLWAICGFSFAFGTDCGGIVGGGSFVLLKNVGIETNAALIPNLPLVLFFVFQLSFAIITPALIAGAVAERMDFKAYCLFIGLWLLFIYSPVAHWVWGQGFLANMGVIDFAGGLVIHLSAGVSSLVAAVVLGARKRMDFTPCNMAYVSIGAGILWAGWFAFNAGSALAANTTAALAVCNTLLASGSALCVWLMVSCVCYRRITLLDSLIGGIAGLIVVTPMAGYIQPLFSLPVGAIGAVACFLAIRAREKFGYDDTLDVWALHGVGGSLGVVLAGVFADPYVAPVAGLLHGNPRQFLLQLMAVATVAIYSVIATFVILKAVNMVVKIRISPKNEELGIDAAIHHETLDYNG